MPTMPAHLTLTIVRGPLQGKAFPFPDRTTCIFGRADDCSPQLPTDAEHCNVSRNHCLLDNYPPDVRIRDFGSLNGTYVNGVKIGQLAAGQTPEEGARTAFPDFDLNTAEADVVETPARIEKEIPFVATAEGTRLLFLWPFLAQRVSPLTGRRTLYVIEGTPDKRRPFRAEVHLAAIDAREQRTQHLFDEPCTSHAWLLQRLRSLSSPLDVPADLGLVR
jgi:pSer/pThr/pTyr-binding forkhead associated (FHA) protein